MNRYQPKQKEIYFEPVLSVKTREKYLMDIAKAAKALVKNRINFAGICDEDVFLERAVNNAIDANIL